MDDDDEIHSDPSPLSGSPASSIGRISVTVAAQAPQPEHPVVNSYALALPIQNQARGSNGGGREDCWSEGATAVLIEAWGERYLELSRGNLKQKHWKEVAEIVNGREDYLKAPKTDIQCKNRIDTVKKKFKSEKAKIAAGGGGGVSKWPFYDRLEYLIGPGPTTKITGVTGGSTSGNSNFPPQKVPLGIPVNLRTNQFNSQKKNQKQQPQPQPQVQLNYQKVQLRPRATPVDSDNSSEREALSPVSSDSLPPGSQERKRAKVNSTSTGWGSAVRELTQAIVKFGEAYEQAETSKLQQIVEMEKQRMKFSKDLELQRMQFFMKTQLEISQLKLGRRKSVTGNGNGNNSIGNPSNHRNNINEKINNNNNSDTE